MGQVALGFKNLLIRAAIFVIMAALLAWALGGTLWPSVRIIDREPVSFQGAQWFWRMEVAAPRDENRPPVVHRLMRHEEGARKPLPAIDREFREVAGLLVYDEQLWIAAIPFNAAATDPWVIAPIGGPDVHFADRLAVEERLAELRSPQTAEESSR